MITKHKLRKAWEEIYKNKPIKKRRNSRGVDLVSIEEFKEDVARRLDDIYRQIDGGFFKFSKLKSYKIKRPGKTPRLIQAPTVRDKVVQKVISDELNKQFRTMFRSTGIVGSVKGTTIEKIIKQSLVYYQKGFVYVLKTDIKNYFPSIDKPRLKKKFYRYISDKELRKYFNQYLEQSTEPGIPQGPPLSPFMANLYLYEFDRALSKLPGIFHFRYLDDLIVFCKSEREAEKTYRIVNKMFIDLGLNIRPLGTEGKTFIGKFDSGRVDILGVEYNGEKLLIKKKKYRQFLSENVTPIQFKSSLESFNLSREEAVRNLVDRLRFKLNGWIGAYSFCDIDESMDKLDDLLRRNLSRLLSRLGIPTSEWHGYLKLLPEPNKILLKSRRKKKRRKRK